jgi:hypothetical protein
VENRRPITEDDIYLTEMLLAKSYGNLRQSVVRVSADTLGAAGEAVGGTIRKYPVATAGAAVGAGILLVLLLKLAGGGGSRGRQGRSEREEKPRSNPAMGLLGMLMPFFMPYVTAYIERSLGLAAGRERK